MIAQQIGSWRNLSPMQWIFAYLAIASLVTMSLFICEESIQTVMFGTWPAQDVRRWDLVLQGSDLIENINVIAKRINFWLGWVQPLAFLSYRAYAKSADFYVSSLRALIVANEPVLMLGREITFEFIAKRIQRVNEGFLISHGRIGVIVKNKPDMGEKISAFGKLIKSNGKYIIDEKQ